MTPRAFATTLAAMLLAALASATAAAPAKPAKAAVTPAQAAAAAGTGHYADRADVRAFVHELSTDTGIPRSELARIIGAARYQPRIVELMNRPIVAPPKWYEYAPSFLDPDRVAAGVAFWDAHAAALARADALYGVPPSIVVAILGVETYYGRITGRYRVLDALATLAFDYPRRASYFRGELKQFVLMAREQRLAADAVQGSFAGAMGLPQFMPGSFRAFAVDFDGDGRIDLWSDPDDAIGSVANYLARHDWQRGGGVLAPLVVDAAARDALWRRLDGGITERRTVAAWRADGVPLAADTANGDATAGVLMLEDAQDASSLYAAYGNFYVITRYNKSRLYASAVFNLAQALEAARGGAASAPAPAMAPPPASALAAPASGEAPAASGAPAVPAQSPAARN